MEKRILIGCYEVPCYGGASTSSYSLFKMIQADGLDVHYLNIIGNHDAPYFKYLFGDKIGNPKGLINVNNCILDQPLFFPKPSHTELANIINDLSPDIMIGIDFIATLLMKREAPNIPIIFLTCGCDQAMQYLLNNKAKCAIELCELIKIDTTKNQPELFFAFEKDAVEIADLIITHSNLNNLFYRYFFSSHEGKILRDIIWFAEWIYNDALSFSTFKKSFCERDIDLIFVSSLWEREVKNYPLMKNIVMKCKGLNIHIVGEVDERIENVVYHGFITKREKIFELLGRSKTVVSTSILDAAPGLLFEASAMDCNLIASRNCGNWKICNEKLLIHNYCIDEYLDKIHLSLTKKFDDNIGYFLETGSYKNLLDTITVM